MVFKPKGKDNMIDVLIKAAKWGQNVNTLDLGKYKVISTGARVKSRNGMVDKTKVLGFLQFTIMVNDEPTVVYRREKKVDPELANGLDYVPFEVGKEDIVYLVVKEGKEEKDGVITYLTVESKEAETSFEIE